ncbi:MAG: HdeD family acid-resistance protein [Candidatus Cybelea sp.]
MKSVVANAAEAVGEARKHWIWYLALGVVLMLIGLYCIWSEGLSTVFSVILLGAILFVAGISQIIGAFMTRGAGHMILMLLGGALEIIIGLMLMEHPALGALTITLFIAALLVFRGIFRFVSALWLQMPQYGWIAVSGIVSVILGILLWVQWPFSAIWFIGFAVGLSFFFEGIAFTSLAFRLRSA